MNAELETLEPIQIVLSENDLDNSTRLRVRAAVEGARVLGTQTESPREVLMDAMPSVIAAKIKQILPADFDLVEMQMKFNVTGKLFGSGVSGEVAVKFAPKKN